MLWPTGPIVFDWIEFGCTFCVFRHFVVEFVVRVFQEIVSSRPTTKNVAWPTHGFDQDTWVSIAKTTAKRTNVQFGSTGGTCGSSTGGTPSGPADEFAKSYKRPSCGFDVFHGHGQIVGGGDNHHHVSSLVVFFPYRLSIYTIRFIKPRPSLVICWNDERI